MACQGAASAQANRARRSQYYWLRRALQTVAARSLLLGCNVASAVQTLCVGWRNFGSQAANTGPCRAPLRGHSWHWLSVVLAWAKLRHKLPERSYAERGVADGFALDYACTGIRIG